jgi:hypothetical protein
VQVIRDIFTNVVANFIFWLGLGVTVGIIARFGQRNFRKFFGLDKNKHLTACLSNLWSTETSDRSRGYWVGLHELRASEAIARLFGTASFRLPDIVRGLVDAIWTGSRVYEFQTTVSPAKTDDPHDFDHLVNNMIVVGGASRNSIRRLYIDSDMVSMKLSNELPKASPHQPPRDQFDVYILVERDPGVHITSAHELAILEKIIDPQHGTVVFFCAGLRGNTTWAATEYLVRSWRDLAKEFGTDPFAVCLGFRPQRYRYDYSGPLRLHTCRAESK